MNVNIKHEPESDDNSDSHEESSDDELLLLKRGIQRAKSTPATRKAVSFATTADATTTTNTPMHVSAQQRSQSQHSLFFSSDATPIVVATPVKSEPVSPSGSSDDADSVGASSSAAPMSEATPTPSAAVTNLTFWQFAKADLVGSYSPAENVYHSRDNVVNFVHVPVFVERFILFGTAVCFDAFLFYFTLLPLRLLFALLTGRWLRSPSPRVDAVRALLFAATVATLLCFNPSILYHNIRGQNVIKLYVIFNVLEIVDKLLRSFGPDVIESLFWALTSRDRGARALTSSGHFLVALGYCIAHSFTHYLQIITLNVAVNSQNHMLTTLLVSNQFVELKTVVYKKYDVRGVFFIVCCDMIERFQLIISLCIVCLQNLHDLQFDTASSAFQMTIWSAVVCYLAECLTDLVKHAFVSSYNQLPVDKYRRMDESLRSDLFDSQPSLFADASHTTTRRIGYAPLPLVCVTVRCLWRFLPEWTAAVAEHWSPWIVFSLLLLALWVAKLSLSFYLFRACSQSAPQSSSSKKRQ
jgi:hypothetical protein